MGIIMKLEVKNMNVSMNAYYKCDKSYKPYEALKEAGFQYLSAAWREEETPLLLGDDWMDHIKRVKELYDTFGFTCVQTHLPCYEILLDCGIEVPESFEEIKRGLVYENIMDAKWGALHLRTATNHGCDVKIAYQHNKELILRLLDTAHKYNVGLAIENMPYFRGADFTLFATNYRDLIELCDEINDPLLGICYDFGHGLLCGDDIPNAIREIGDRLKIVHIHNNANNNYDAHDAPAFGKIQWASIAKALADIHYDGSLSGETGYPEEEMFAATFFKHVRESLEIIQKLVEGYKKEIHNTRA